MKTAGRENQNRWCTVPGNRVYGAAGQNRSHLISWAAKQEKIQPAWISFFLTSSFIEQIGNLGTGTHFGGNRVNQALKLYLTEMLKAQSTITLFSLPLVFVLTFACTRVLAQGFAADWPATHKNDLSKWAAKTGLSFKTLDELTKVATEEDASEVDEGYFWYTIENVDAKTLSKQKHILLSTWAAGTGHCLTLYVLKRTGSNFEKVWQSYDNLCTRSILGAAKTRAKADGTISVTYREYSVDSDPKKDALPILMVTLTYRWDGTAYINAGRIERPEASVSVR